MNKPKRKPKNEKIDNINQAGDIFFSSVKFWEDEITKVLAEIGFLEKRPENEENAHKMDALLASLESLIMKGQHELETLSALEAKLVALKDNKSPNVIVRSNKINNFFAALKE